MYYRAFLDLTTCRNSGYGSEGPISWFTIDDYALRCDYSQEQREDLHYFIPLLDEVYLTFKAEKLKAAMAKGST